MVSVEIRSIPDTRVAYMRHIGPYAGPGIADMWPRFIAACMAAGLKPMARRRFGLTLDDPSTTPAAQCRYDACVEVDDTFQPIKGLAVRLLLGGRFATAPFTGTAADIDIAWQRLFGEWLPASGHRPEARPPMELYEANVAVDETTGKFSCDLCVAVRES